LARLTYYYQRQEVPEEGLELMRLIDECHLRHPCYGSRRIFNWLEYRGRLANRKRVQRHGLDKNAQCVFTRCALVNLVLAKKQLLAI